MDHPPSMPVPFSGDLPDSARLPSVHNENAINDTISQNDIEEKHWRDLEKFFEENEQAIQKAERSSVDSQVEDVRLAIGFFIDTAKVVLDGLTVLAKVHPALAIAIVAFNGIISLDITRRENDQKVIAVKLEMQTMMCAMFQFRKLKHRHGSEADHTSAQAGLRRLMKTIAEEIKACGSDLHYYSERNTLSRAMSSKFYERRFAGHVETFSLRRAELQTVVAGYIASGMDAANAALASIGNTVQTMGMKIDSVLSLFQKLQTSRERDLLQFITDNGGLEKCVDEDRLLTRLLAMSGDSPKALASGSDAREQQLALSVVRKDLKNDMQNLEVLLTKNLSRFENLLQIQSDNLKAHMEDTTTRLDQIYASAIKIFDQGKLIERAIISPAASLTSPKDPVLQRVWDSMGLRGSVKAKTFILNFRDHMSMDHSTAETPLIATPQSKSIDLPPMDELKVVDQGESKTLNRSGQNVFSAELKDDWALQYLTVSYVRPITEAIDEDCSGFISVKEANKFAQARPPGRSLISWMAYWATGWHRNLTMYKNQIYSTILQMHQLSKRALPLNKQLIKCYLNDYSHLRLEAVLRSIKSFPDALGVDTGLPLDELSSFVAAQQESQLTRNLLGVSYILKSDSDIQLVASFGRQRVETWILPLVHLILKRHLDIILIAQKTLIHANEMVAHEKSLRIILDAFDKRLNKLEAIFQQEYQSNVEARFKAFAYGMFYTTFKQSSAGYSVSESTLRERKIDHFYETMDLVEAKLSEVPPDVALLSEGPGEKFSYVEDDENVLHEVAESSPAADEEARHPLIGSWSTRFDKRPPFEIKITSAKEGKIAGKARLIDGAVGSIVGDYKTESRVPGGVVDFDLSLHRKEDDYLETRYCSAIYNPDREWITGTWLASYHDGVEAYERGTFVARRVPMDLYIVHADLVDSLGCSSDPMVNARQRWSFAIAAVRFQTKTRSRSKVFTLARIKGANELIRVHYESLQFGGIGVIPNDRADVLSQADALGLPRAPMLYKSLGKYRLDRMMDHWEWMVISYTSSPYCDNCYHSTLHVRYQCITCTPDTFIDQVDLCQRCWKIDDVATINRNSSFVHRTSHSLLRSTSQSWIGRHDLAWMIPLARTTSEKVKDRFREISTLKARNPSHIAYESSLLGRSSKETPPPRCSLCDTLIAALPVWTPMEYYGDSELICTNCMEKGENDNSPKINNSILLWVPNSVRVWPNEAKYTRLDERIEDMDSRITAVANEVNSLRDGLDARMSALESRVNGVNGQLSEILSTIKSALSQSR